MTPHEENITHPALLEYTLGDERYEVRYGRRRLYRAVECSTCAAIFFKRDSFIKPGQRHFCKKLCASLYISKVVVPAPEGQKTCRKCLQPKSIIDGFYVRNKSSDGKTAYCKECINEERTCAVEQVRAYREGAINKVRIKGRKSLLKTKYGITIEEYEAMLEAQDGKCAICKVEEIRIVRGTLANLAVDHCHKTLKVRGLLCDKCNRGIALFEDDPIILRAAIEYLTR